MKVLRSKLLLIVLTVIMAISCMGFCVTLINAKADAQAKTVDDVSFVMDQGASIRLTSGNETNGLRFTALMSKEDYDGLKANTNYKSVSFGLVVLPRNYIDHYDITVENVFGANAKYDWSVNGVYTGKDGADGSKVRIINLEYEDLLLVEDSYYVLYGSITNILDSNLVREFVGKAYIKYTLEQGGTVGYKFAEYSGDDVKGNTRSMVYVAQRALQDKDSGLTETEKAWINTNYIAKVSTVSANYKVADYVEDLNGKYIETAAQTKSANINSSVTLSEKVYADHFVDVDNEFANPSDIVYANDKTELSVYYNYTDSYRINKVVTDKAEMATEFGMRLWSKVGNKTYYSFDDTLNAIDLAVVDGDTLKNYYTLNSDLIKEAVKAGAEKLTIKFKADYKAWVKAFGGDDVAKIGTEQKPTNLWTKGQLTIPDGQSLTAEQTLTINLADLKDSNDIYKFAFSSVGAGGLFHLYVTSLQFSYALDMDSVDLTKDLATVPEYVQILSGGSAISVGTDGFVIGDCAHAAQPLTYINSKLLKRAVDEGYTKVTIKLYITATGASVWTSIFGGDSNGTRPTNIIFNQSNYPANQELTKEITLDSTSTIKCSDGSYSLCFKSLGNDRVGYEMHITSIVFSGKPAPFDIKTVDLTKDLATVPQYVKILSGGSAISVGTDGFVIGDCAHAAQPLTYISSELLKRAVDEGYTKVTIKLYITATGASVWTSIFGGNWLAEKSRPTNILFNQSNYPANQVLTKEITLDSTSTIKCSDGTYSLCFKSLGNDKAGYEMHITSIVFGGRDPLASVDLTKDLATVPEYVKILSGGSAISVGTDGFVIGDCTHAAQPLTYIDGGLIKRAVKEGYTKVTVKLYITATGGSVWTSIFGGNWLAEKSRPTNILFNQSNYPANQVLTKEITLDSTSTIKCSDGTYSLCFKTLGNDKAGYEMHITSIVFGGK